MKAVTPEHAKNFFLNADTALHIPSCAYTDYLTEQLQALCARPERTAATPVRAVTLHAGIPDALRAAFTEEHTEEAEVIEVKDSFVENVGGIPVERKRLATEEEYVLSIGEHIDIYATTDDGFLRALSTLMIESDKGGLCEGRYYDAPACGIRGYRVYLPGRESIGAFIEMLDFLVYYKYNKLILEIGGAMEYKRHPRINEKWVEFCADMNAYSGRTEEIQKSQQWSKNSIHSENGDGSYLTQAECRMLAAECRRRGIELIPECPTLSHSDYICLAYPELAERQNDPYPDTYCPSNPDTYRVVFDILDEVIEVFDPKNINIGHDEFYSVGICPRCQGKDLARIYADDVKTLSEYLAAKGIGTYMWGEKLVKARYSNGKRIGGWYEEKTYHGVRFQIPWLFRCADMMPTGVTYLHWYWPFGTHLDDEFHARAYPVVFGNFNALQCADYRTRINRGVLGGFVSNWGSFAPEYMQRNLQYYDLICTAEALWSDTYDTPDAPVLRQHTLDAMYTKYCASIKHPLKVLHTAHHTVPSTFFWCGIFIEDAVYLLGHYELSYTDGTKALLPVKLGTNVASHTASEWQVNEAGFAAHAIPDGEGFLFEHLYENPHPDKKIATITYLPAEGKEEIRVDYTFPEL